MRSDGLVIGVDLGGTKILVGAVDEEGRVVDKERDLTHAEETSEQVIGRVAALIHTLKERLGDRQVEAVSIGVPGAVDRVSGTVERAPNLRWQSVPLAAILSPLVDLPVLIDNDVRVAVAGEHAHGAGAKARTMIGVWVGTGIGGGLILDGELHGGGRGAAGELGHTIVVAKGPRCPCGNRGCIEALASRTSIERDVRAAIAKGAKSNILKLMKKKGRDTLSSSVIERALDDKDPVMLKVFGKALIHLGIFASNLINTFDPEVIAFGGGMVERLGERFVAPIREIAYKLAFAQHDIEQVRILPGALGEDAPIVGAAVLARARLHPPVPVSLFTANP